ncbi:lytic polysaccharide monooxygenase, partial [Trichocladium antarcticum]
MFFTKTLVAAGGLATLSQAHMLLRTPAPYTSPQIQSGPLDPSGSNFPCQSTGGAFVGAATSMAKGSKQSMGFTGSAVHGGGSCQISITYDNPPTKDSAFKVIHSIQGGCPARNTPGNLPDNPSGAAPDTYDFTIPDDIPAGNATLAWSWMNKIGNREFYMNCAPVDITGDGGSEAALDALPDMLTANIGGGCTTAEGVDVEFPNPGKSVETNPGAALGAPVGDCGGSAGG